MMPNSAIASINRLVAIGRRMNTSERFMKVSIGNQESGMWNSDAHSRFPIPNSKCSTGAAAASSALAAAGRGIEIGRHPRAGLEPQLAFGDHRFTGADARVDDHILIDALGDGHRALLDG